MTNTSGATALDHHRDLNTDRDAVDAIRSRIAESGVEYVYYQAVTLTGRVIGKMAPARRLVRNIENGIQQYRALLADLRTAAGGTLLGGGYEATEYTAMPDLDTFAVLPWDRRTGRFFCRLYEPAHAPGGRDGQPLALDVRGHLRRELAAFTLRTGLELRSGCEPETSWSASGNGTRPHVGPRPGESPAHHVDSLESHRPVCQRIMAYGHELDLEMIEGNHEGDPGQLELNWEYDHAARTADRMIVHRQICRQVARELGLTVSFMPKPADDRTGNSCHHNLSLWRGETNVLVDPTVRRLHLTEIGRHAVGGILSHAGAASAVMGPTVNSYKRYAQANPVTPTRADWGLDNKTCTVRLPVNGRLEVRSPDALVNPYLSHAVLLAAIEDGIKNEIDPGPPKEGAYGDGTALFPDLPLTLGEALDRFDADPVVTSALGAETAELYRAVKAAEWMGFCGAVTDWEQRMYADAGC
ncbi:glutamine synthetase [Nocardiopsis gilva YIM 90087]|uniref:glutamine synthetase n=1 Tax=Nocardiopsis gilva YIM 90087 TaxID=1235441 RepID=A0A223S8H0_9ACTN|nr:glutamine synthetase family protein [Nocardiopsis gilva]ASU84411.1 glutamine synthetase [Nocardiopsis gilva YIM 90087]